MRQCRFVMAGVLAAAVASLGTASAQADSVVCGQLVTRDLTLTADLVGCPGDGLTVRSDFSTPNITIDLNGHTIRGSGQGIGIRVVSSYAEPYPPPAVEVILTNGTIAAFSTGVSTFFNAPLRLTLRHMVVTGNYGDGILDVSGSGDLFDDVIVSFNGGSGIDLGHANATVKSSALVGNGRGVRTDPHGGAGIAGVEATFESDLVSSNNVLVFNPGLGFRTATSGSRSVGDIALFNGRDGFNGLADFPGEASFFASNVAEWNGGRGIVACSSFCGSAVSDGGGNLADRNASGPQCVNVVCAPVDLSGDGVADSLHPAGMPSGSFADSGGTSGSIIDRGGSTIVVTDAPDPADGVLLTVGPGTGRASFSVCGSYSLRLDAQSAVVVNCGSLTVRTLAGLAEVPLGGGVTLVSAKEGGKVRISDLGGGEFFVDNTGTTTAVGVAVGGATTLLAPGATTTVGTDLYLHGAGGVTNPTSFSLDARAPTATAATYLDSGSVAFAGGNPWSELGTWSAAPSDAEQTYTSFGDLHAWLGVKNRDDQGTKVDLRAEVYVDGTLVAAGTTHCIPGITRNPNSAKESIVSLPVVSDFTVAPTDVLRLKLLARIGTKPDGSKCAGPGGIHASVDGLRVYFDSTDRPSRVGA